MSNSSRVKECGSTTVAHVFIRNGWSGLGAENAICKMVGTWEKEQTKKGQARASLVGL